MDKNRIEGEAKKAKGALKEAAGKATGDRSLEGKGRGDKAAGSVQSAAGKGKDALRDANKR